MTSLSKSQPRTFFKSSLLILLMVLMEGRLIAQVVMTFQVPKPKANDRAFWGSDSLWVSSDSSSVGVRTVPPVLFDLRTKRTSQLKLPSGLQADVTFINSRMSPSYRLFVKHPYIYETKTGNSLITLHEDPASTLKALCFSLDEKKLAGSVVRHHYEEQNAGYGRKKKVDHPEPVLVVWDVKTGAMLNEFKTVQAPADCLAFSPDSTRLISGGGIGNANTGWVSELKIWNLNTSSLERHVVGHRPRLVSFDFFPNRGISTVVVAPDGETFFTECRHPKECILWKASDGTSLRFLREMSHQQYSKQGKWIAGIEKTNQITVYETSGNTVPFVVKSDPEREGGITSFCFSNDEMTLFAGTAKGRIAVFDVATGQRRSKIVDLRVAAHSKPIGAVALTPDGKHLATLSLDGVLNIWDLNHSLLKF